MNQFLKFFFLIFILAQIFSSKATAHTANISSSRIIAQENQTYRVEVGFLGTDIERMIAENKAALHELDLTEPGLIEGLVGKFIQSRISLQNEQGQICQSSIVSVGEDPTNPSDSKAVFEMDCHDVSGNIFYDPYKLINAQGPRAKHLVSIGEKINEAQLTDKQRQGLEPAPGQVMIYPGDKPIDLSEPLLGPWELAPKFFNAGIEHIITGYDHLCFLLAVILWASRIWPVVKIVTAFTLSHSVTLTLAALELVNLPSNWVEIAVAVSIIYVAIENFYTRKIDSRWKDTFAFGFIHGFGFASGLIELGIPQRAIVPALASFNIGVEVGQISVVLLILPLLFLIDKYLTNGARSKKLVYVSSAIIACFGAYWMLVRLELIKEFF
jgi:hydrogenase/urease accessory protein HupE